MLRSMKQVALWLLGLLLAYLLLVRLVLSFVQFFPESATDSFSNLTSNQLSFEAVQIDQNLLGFDLKIKALSYETDELRLHVDDLAFDFNLFAPLIPGQSVGNRFELSQSHLVLKHSNLDSDSHNKDVLKAPIYKLWKSVQVNSFVVSAKRKHWHHLRIKEFSAYSGARWSFGGRLAVAMSDEASPDLASWSDIQFFGDLKNSFSHRQINGNFSGSILTPIRLSDFDRLIPASWFKVFSEGELTGDFKAVFDGGRVESLVLSAGLQSIQWKEAYLSNPKSVSVSLDWVDLSESLIDKNAWIFRLDRIRFENQYVSNTSPIFISLDQEELSFSVQRLDEALIKPLLQTYLTTINSTIKVENLKKFEVSKFYGQIDLFNLYLTQLKLDIENFEFASGEDRLGIASDFLHIEKRGALVQINSSALTVDIPDYQTLQVDPLKKFTFSLDEVSDWAVENQLFSVNEIDFEVDGFGHGLNYQDLQLSAKFQDLMHVKQSLPYAVMSLDLQKWLQKALISGDSASAQVSIKGNVFSESFWSSGEGFRAEAEVSGVELKFDKNWPPLQNLNAQLMYQNFDLTIQGSSAEILGANVKNITTEIQRLHQLDGMTVNISGQIDTSFQNARSVMLETPIAKLSNTKSFLNNIDVSSGQVMVDLNSLIIPIEEVDATTVEGNARFINASGVFYDYFPVNQIEGGVKFSDTAVSADGLKGRFHNGPVEVDVLTDPSTKATVVNLEGTASYDANNVFAEGKLPFKSSINVKSSEAKIDFTLDISQLVSSMPAPLSEQEMANQQIRPKSIKGHVLVRGDEVDTEIKVGNLVEIKGKRALSQSSFGDWQINQPRLSHKRNAYQLDLENAGIQIGLKFFSVDLDQWVARFPKMQSALSQAGIGHSYDIYWKSASVEAEEVIALGANFHNTKVSWLNLDNQDLVVQVSGDEIDLSIKQSGDRYLVKSNQLTFNTGQEVVDAGEVVDAVSETNKSCRLRKDRAQYPDIDFVATNVSVNGSLVKSLQFRLKDSEKELRLEGLQGAFGEKGSFSGDYRYGKQKNKSYLQAAIRSKSSNDIVEFLQIDKGVNGKKAKVDLNLNWSGRVDCFSLIDTKGKLTFEFLEGQIEQANPGFAKLLGLLSIEALARRLKLDLKDVAYDGLFYDSVKGQGRFQKGIFGIEKLELKAPSADARVFGEVNLIQKEVNLSADITPAIGSSLPALAAISGVATPIAGLAVYTLLKIVPAINEDLVTYRYEVNGPLASPKIKDKGLQLDLINAQTQSKESILDFE